MAITGQQAVNQAAQHLGTVTANGSANADQSAQCLIALNQMLASWQARGVNGSSIVTAVASNVTTVTITSTAVATFASLPTSNTYPTGWEEAITLNLAVLTAGLWGKVNPERLAWLKEQADIALQAITPPKGS